MTTNKNQPLSEKDEELYRELLATFLASEIAANAAEVNGRVGGSSSAAGRLGMTDNRPEPRTEAPKVVRRKLAREAYADAMGFPPEPPEHPLTASFVRAWIDHKHAIEKERGSDHRHHCAPVCADAILHRAFPSEVAAR